MWAVRLAAGDFHAQLRRDREVESTRHTERLAVDYQDYTESSLEEANAQGVVVVVVAVVVAALAAAAADRRHPIQNLLNCVAAQVLFSDSHHPQSLFHQMSGSKVWNQAADQEVLRLLVKFDWSSPLGCFHRYVTTV